MEVTSQVDKSASEQYLRYFFLRSNLGNRMVVVALAAWFVGNYTGYDNGRAPFQVFRFSYGFISGGLIAYLAVFILPFLLERYRWSRPSRNAIFVNKSVTTGEKGFGVIENGKAVVVPWGAINVLRIGGGFIYFKLVSGKIYLIPFTAFPSREAAAGFIDICQQALFKARPDLVPKQGRQLYGWGLLGIIPGVGSVVGVVLLIKGIFQFRSKGLVLLGTGCIVYTIVFWYVATAYMKRVFPDLGKPMNTSVVATSFLEITVVELESYKRRSGVYPDSLDQPNALESASPGVDPFSRESNEPGIRLFNYKKIGNRYALSCSGPDLTAGTADDIFPDSSYYDSTKFGLIRE